MICATCGGPVLWMGPLTSLTHTECQECGAVNNQAPEQTGQDDELDGDEAVVAHYNL